LLLAIAASPGATAEFYARQVATSPAWVH